MAGVFASVSRAPAASTVPGKDADAAAYAIAAGSTAKPDDTAPMFEAANPANDLRLRFSWDGVAVAPRVADARPWSLDLRLSNIDLMGQRRSVGTSRISASGNSVAYELGSASLRYANGPDGLLQVFTIPMPAVHVDEAGAATLSLDLTIGSDLTPQAAGYFVDLLAPGGRKVLRYGAIRATDANGTLLSGTINVVPESEGKPASVRIVVELADPASPVEVHATVSQSTQLALGQPAAGSPEIVGKPVTLGSGITQTVEEIMERERNAPPLRLAAPRETYHEFEEDLELKEDPNAPIASVASAAVPWTPEARAALAGPPSLPQAIGVNFQGAGISEAPYIPPDSMGAVGPTQVLVHTNGRIKSFTKAGALDGALNATDVTFWSSVAPGGISDPEVRYDRLSGRWVLLAITIAETTNNKIVLAVSSGPTISSQASFTFFSFSIGTPAPADATSFCDFPSLGVDANAIYTGCNMFSSAGSFRWTSAFVIRKSSVLGGGPIVVTGFPTIATGTVAGPYAPRGVDNDDPTWTEGYIIGTDPGVLNRINIRRVSTPGGTPTLGANVTLAVTTTNMTAQRASGSTTQIDVSDVRLFMASIRKNKLTGVTSLWTAHSVETTTACVAATSGNTRRVGARWYEIGTLTTTPTITQQGTLCTTATGAATLNSERGFMYPTVTETGQGHMALSASYASSAQFAGVASAGRLRTDASGGTRAPETIVQTGLAAYTLNDGSGRNRWGDYSSTQVDPNDDQTVWTFQEYADLTSSCPYGSCWSLRAVQLKAPPPPPIATATSVCAGLASVTSTIMGTDACTAPTCTNGLCTGGGTCPEFFDPGPDTGGPGYANHISATIGGGVNVNAFPSTTIVIPGSPSTSRVLQATLSLNTTAASGGTQTLTMVNPDGQTSTGSIVVAAATPSNNGPICAGQTLQLSAATVPGATYGWTGPNGFSSSLQNPSIPNASAAAAGTYHLTVTLPGICSTPVSTTVVSVIADGGSCTDGNACTSGDICQAGACVGASTVVCSALDQCHVAGTCNPATGVCTNPNAGNGTSCNGGNLCTTGDTCQAGSCTSGAPVVCTASDQCHVAGVCNPVTGTCSNPNATDGTSCSDGNACTQSDSCQTGVCVGSSPVTCTASDQCHVAGVCNPGTGLCSNPNAADGTSCSDGNACTQSDSCQTGVCVGSNPVTCTASDQCHVAGVCNPGTGTCSNPNATDGSSCSDGNACTQSDSCQTGVCVGSSPVVCTASDQCHVAGACNPGTGVCSNPNATDGTLCNDGNACTQSDSCQTGTCVGSNPVVCTASDQCHDAGVCNPGTGVCSNPNATDGTSCSDANACTQTDSCQAGVCIGASPITCTASDQCHVAGVCNPGTGTCSNPNATDGTSCSDGNACTQSDSCQTGVCVGSNPVACTASDQCHVAGVCNPGTGTCSNPNATNGTACGDGNACTQTDSCQTGVCVGSNPVTCTASDQCHLAGVCNPGTGTCSNPNATDGTSCSDGNACTQTDSCQTGVCVGSTPVTCTASDQCHVAGVCNPGTGTCSNPNAIDGTSCSDGNACTQSDSCQTGVCVGSNPVTCTASDQCHVAGVCNPGTGTCSNPHATDGTSCSDGNACTQTDSCQTGVCVGSNPVTCAASDQCHVAGVCNPGTGVCSNPNATDGTSCSDGNACTQTDSCQTGVCVGSTPVTCTASDQCHVSGVCNPGTGTCSNPNASNGIACSDGNACTQTDSCQTGVCVGSNPVTCTASDQCHVAGVCNPGTGVCSNPNATDGTSCSDGNACTQTDSCQTGVCVGSNPVTCTASDQCHVVGVCNPGTGTCSNPNAIDGTSCSDGNACTQTDSCQTGVCVGSTPVTCTASDQCHVAGVCNPGTGTCSNPNASDGTSCSDGNACTQTDSCQTGVCVGSNPVTCTASDQCHVAGVCNPGTGTCSNPNATDGTSCNDGNACTQSDSCQTGVCVGSNPVTCTASDQCHVAGVCNPGTGVCSNPNATDGTSCSDASACTQTDVCETGVCVGSNPVTCTASDQCHVAGVCNPGTGTCSDPNAADGTSCSDGNACTQTDSCQTGVCVGSSPVTCTASDQCHVAGVCNPGTGICSNPNAADGASCNDANACTQSDSCQAGTCVGSSPVVCIASDQCHVAGVCNPGTGTCSNPVASDGTACSDGNQCTAGDVCTAGVCNGAPVPPPTAINDSVRADKIPTNTTITWNDPPGSCNVYRGLRSGGAAWSYNQTCLSTGVVGNSAPDTGVPLSSQMFYYLVSRADACGESSLGSDSAGTLRPNNSPCP